MRGAKKVFQLKMSIGIHRNESNYYANPSLLHLVKANRPYQVQVGAITWEARRDT